MRSKSVGKAETPAPRFGEVLVRMLATTPGAVDRALERQAASGRNLGAELLDAGDVSSTAIHVAAGIQAKARGGDAVGAAQDTLDRAYRTLAHDVEATRAKAAEGVP